MPVVSAVDPKLLTSTVGIHPLAARVLINRGYTSLDSVTAFLADQLTDLPDPFRMKGMRSAVQRISEALAQGQKITLYGDYDVDGVCSTALLYLFLKEIGAQVSTYIPHRLEEGYGLNTQALERLGASGTKLVITLDCGINSFAEVTRAGELGLEVIVVDHHAVSSTLPPATAILNPHQPGCDYPTRHLCAAGVAFNLCLGIRKRLREDGFFNQKKEPNLRSMLDLVALATVADVVPLTGANRILVKHGLREITLARRPGVRALKEVSGLDPLVEVTSGQIGFRLGPRINAAGRLHDASIGLQLLCADTLETARPLAQALDAANLERRGIEQDILAAAIQQADSRSEARGLVLSSDSWHPGVIGIVASRVVERFHRPTFLIALKDGVGRGSGRSVEGFHLVGALEECSAHLIKFGGHKQAAGLSVEQDRLAEFSRAFEQVAARTLSEEDILPRCRVDAVVSLSELDCNSVRGLEALAPFGSGNPEPVFASQTLSAKPRVLANRRQGQADHLKLFLESAPHLDAIGFGMSDRAPLAQGPVDLAYQLSVDQWKGQERISLKLKDVRTSG
jgi:single-stranded-DNA-specific exonuclease